jgi:hypothetical protein
VLRHHLQAGDFSHWLSDSLGDDELAGSVRQIERWYRTTRNPGTVETRAALLRAVERRYGDGPCEELHVKASALVAGV